MLDLASVAGIGLGDGMRPVEALSRLARTPVEPIAYGSSDEVIRELLAARDVA